MFLARNSSVAAAGAAGQAPLGAVLAALFVPALCDQGWAEEGGRGSCQAQLWVQQAWLDEWRMVWDPEHRTQS